MILFYFGIMTILVLIAFGEYDSTMRFVAYVDLSIRYQIVLLKLWFMKNRMELRLKKDTTEYKRLIEERKNV